MNESAVTKQDVDEILRLLERADHVAEFRIRYGGLEISYSRTGSQAAATAPALAPGPAAASPVTAATAVRQPEPASAPPPASGSAGARGGDTAIPAGMAAVKAPMVGTFYRAPSPGAKPFVEVGSRVKADTTVGIIEVMKLMNSLTAGVAGVVREIRVADSQPVGFGEALVLIEPDE
jgi:acetyl-CoA carboxylase biotin carboxyl carrier protein